MVRAGVIGVSWYSASVVLVVVAVTLNVASGFIVSISSIQNQKDQHIFTATTTNAWVPSTVFSSLGARKERLGAASSAADSTVGTTTDYTSSSTKVSLLELLSTCVDACFLGCAEIQAVQRRRQVSQSAGAPGTGAHESSSSFRVEYKNGLDPKSALTEADGAAQRAIVTALRREWGHDDELHIVGEEDEVENVDDDDDVENHCATVGEKDTAPDTTAIDAALKRDWCRDIQNAPRPLSSSSSGHDRFVSLNDVTIYVDPLDGTREFVEGRLSNCQCLIGIAVNGEALAGAIGIPFAFSGQSLELDTNDEDASDDTSSNDASSATVVVYGAVGMGHGVVGRGGGAATVLAIPPSNIESTTLAVNSVVPRPILATGDSTIAIMKAARDIATKMKRRSSNTDSDIGNGHVDAAATTPRTTYGTNVLYGGAGNKILATALGHVDATIQHCYGGPWDTCAPTAILRSMGGRITNLVGVDIFDRQVDADEYHTTNAPSLGFVATGANSMIHHDELIHALLANTTVLEYVQKQERQQPLQQDTRTADQS